MPTVRDFLSPPQKKYKVRQTKTVHIKKNPWSLILFSLLQEKNEYAFYFAVLLRLYLENKKNVRKEITIRIG